MAATPLTAEQWLTTALQLQPESTGLPTAFIRDLLLCEHTETEAERERDRDDSVPPAGVVLDRPYVTALAGQLEAAGTGVWPQPPQMRNPELVALEQDCSAERAQWLGAVVPALSGGGLDETSACKLLAALGTRGIASLLGQRCVSTHTHTHTHTHRERERVHKSCCYRGGIRFLQRRLPC